MPVHLTESRLKRLEPKAGADGIHERIAFLHLHQGEFLRFIIPCNARHGLPVERQAIGRQSQDHVPADAHLDGEDAARDDPSDADMVECAKGGS